MGAKLNLKPSLPCRLHKLISTGITCLLTTGVIGEVKDISYDQQVLPLLEQYCFDCHGEGASKGGLSLDSWKSPAERVADLHVWKEVLRNVSLKVMPPAKRKDQPNEQERDLIGLGLSKGFFDMILIILTPVG